MFNKSSCCWKDAARKIGCIKISPGWMGVYKQDFHSLEAPSCCLSSGKSGLFTCKTWLLRSFQRSHKESKGPGIRQCFQNVPVFCFVLFCIVLFFGSEQEIHLDLSHFSCQEEKRENTWVKLSFQSRWQVLIDVFPDLFRDRATCFP